MDKIVVCVENPAETFEEIGQTAAEYFDGTIQPSLAPAGYEGKLLTCPQALEHLEGSPVNVLLLLVRSKESCCWQVARHVRRECSQVGEPPLILLMVFWDDYSPNPAYYVNQPGYGELYDDYTHHFVVGRNIGGWIDCCLTDHSFSPELLEERIVTEFATPKEKLSWQVLAMLSHHVMVDLTIYDQESAQEVTIIWSRDTTIQALDSWDGLAQIFIDSGLTLARHAEDMVSLFSGLQKKNVLTRVGHPDETIAPAVYELVPEDAEFAGKPTFGLLVSKSLQATLSKYAEAVQRPVFWGEGDVHYVRFWTADLQGTGDLEEWLITQQGNKLEIKSWLREEGFVADFGNCIRYSRIGEFISAQRKDDGRDE